MFKFFKKNAQEGRFVELTSTSGLTGKDAADKIVAFLKEAKFEEPYPEFTVLKSDLEMARISEYHLCSYINELNKDNKDISYTISHPKGENDFPDYGVTQFAWEHVLFEHEYPEAAPQKVIIVESEEK